LDQQTGGIFQRKQTYGGPVSSMNGGDKAIGSRLIALKIIVINIFSFQSVIDHTPQAVFHKVMNRNNADLGNRSS
jgi:hypothetical protein